MAASKSVEVIDATTQTDECAYENLIFLVPKLIKKLADEINFLLLETRNFNTHLIVFKKLLNLKDKKDGQQDFFNLTKNVSNGDEEVEEQEHHDFDSIFQNILAKYKQLKSELNISHSLTSCFVFNLQTLHKEVTGSPLDQDSAQELFNGLQKEHGKLRTAEAILKYELQQKRKMVTKFKDQLETSKEEWKYMKLKNFDCGYDWKSLRESFLNRQQQMSEDSEPSSSCEPESLKTPPENDSAFQSECEMPISGENSRRRIDLLEEQCNLLFSNLVQSAQRNEAIEERLADLFEESHHQSLETDDDEEELPDLYTDEEPEELDEIDLESENVSPNLNTEETNLVTVNESTPQNHLSVPNEMLFSSLEHRRPSFNLLNQNEHQELVDHSLADLRKKALDTLVKRLKDEKLFHVGKEAELNEQVDNLVLQNSKLKEELETLKQENCVIAGRDLEFRKRAEFIFRQEREAFESRLNQYYESKAELQVDFGVLKTKLAEKEEAIDALKQDLNLNKEELHQIQSSLQNEIKSLREKMNQENELYEELLIKYRQQELTISGLRGQFTEQENMLLEFDKTFLDLKEARFREQQRFWQQLEELEALQRVREEECAIFSDEIKRRRKEQDENQKETKRLKTLLEEIKTKSREIYKVQENQIFELKSDNEILKKKVIIFAKEKDLLWKKAHQLINDQSLSSGRWINDKEAKKCMRCNVQFTFTLRKHHCRICGRIFCNACSNNWLLTPFRKQKSRACDDCCLRQSQTGTTNIEALLHSINCDEINNFIDSFEHCSSKFLPENNLPEFFNPQPCNKSTSNFDVIDDEEIVQSLSACSPYNYFDEETLKIDGCVDEMQMSITRTAKEIESLGWRGLEGEIWISPGCKYALPFIVDYLCKIEFELDSFPSIVDYLVQFKDSFECSDSELFFGEEPFNSKIVRKKELIPNKTGVYIFVINNCYVRYLAAKIKYRFVFEKI